MRHHLLRLTTTTTTTMAPSSSPSKTTTNRKPSSNPNFNPHPNSNSYPNCTHSPSATLDILILILVLFSGAFLISSYFSYIFHSLTLILPPLSVSTSTFTSLIAGSSAAVYLVGFLIFFVVSIIGFEICCGNWSRKCGKKGCKGLKKAMEFDLQLQTEEILRSGGKSVKEVEELPWKGGSETNLDYECLRSELRKMAPPNGRAVLLFRMKCGCPVAKLEGWGPKPRRRNKKSLALNGGGDHR